MGWPAEIRVQILRAARHSEATRYRKVDGSCADDIDMITGVISKAQTEVNLSTQPIGVTGAKAIKLAFAGQAAVRNDDKCAICLEPITSGEQLFSSCGPCKHVFHAECLRRAHKSTPTCPLCRGNCTLTAVPLVGVPTRITSLLLADCRLCGINKRGKGKYDVSGISAIAEILRFDSALTKLNVSGNFIGKQGAQQIAAALRDDTCALTSLNISHNAIGDDGAVAIGTALKSATECRLQELTMNENGIEETGAKAMGDFCATSDSLTTLNLDGDSLPIHNLKKEPNIHIKSNLGRNAAAVIVSSIIMNRSLKSLKLNAQDIGPEGVREICATIIQMMSDRTIKTKVALDVDGYNINIGLYRSIPQLKLFGSQMTDLAIAAVACLVRNANPSIQLVEVQNNKIGKDGATELVNVLQQHKDHLTGFNISNNIIGSLGAQAIAKALPQFIHLVRLMMSGNDIGSKGARAIAEVLNETSLTHLELDNNGIDDEGAIYLASALQTNTTLEYIGLANNRIHSKGSSALKARTARRTNFVLDLDGNMIAIQRL